MILDFRAVHRPLSDEAAHRAVVAHFRRFVIHSLSTLVWVFTTDAKVTLPTFPIAIAV